MVALPKDIRSLSLSLRLDLYEGQTGRLALDLEAIPRRAARDYPFVTAEIVLDGASPSGEPARTLTFDEAVSGPFGTDELRKTGGLRYLHLYQPEDANEVFDLHRSNMATFTRFFRQYGETCCGSFGVRELGPGWVAEWYGVDTSTREKYWLKVRAVELPLEIQDIVDAGRHLQSQSPRHYFFWLSPRLARVRAAFPERPAARIA